MLKSLITSVLVTSSFIASFARSAQAFTAGRQCVAEVELADRIASNAEKKYLVRVSSYPEEATLEFQKELIKAGQQLLNADTICTRRGDNVTSELRSFHGMLMNTFDSLK
jgi:hypothetical protein